MKKSIIGMLALLLLSSSLLAQQWSSDPWADRLKQLEAEVIRAQEFMNWCEQPQNRHEDKCSGVNGGEASHTKFVTWEEAMKLAGEKPVSQEPPSLGEAARRFRVEKLQKKLEPLVADFCKKNPATKICSLAIPSVIARQISEQCGGFETNLSAVSQKQK